MADAPLTDLEREILEVCYLDSAGETTTTLLAELESPPDRATLEATLRGLVDRGLVAHWVGTHVASQHDPVTGQVSDASFEDDWWPVTDAGRAAIGVRPRAETVESGWMNPSSGAWHVSPLIAPYCEWRFRRGKPPVPRWYARLTGRPQIGR